MKIDFINLSRQYEAYKDRLDTAIHQILDSSAFIMGKEVGEIEDKLSQYTQAPYAIGCSSGTDALILSLMCLGVGVGDEVITTPFSFFASSEAIAFLGAKPVFVDIDEETYNINPNLIEQEITNKTKAILPVSLFGQTSDMDAINKIAQKYQLAVIEDASQSFGAQYKNNKSCNLSRFGVTSFFPSKPLGCFGDGGAVFCQNEEDAQKIRSLLKHGQSQRYHHQYIGMNARLDTIQAGVLLVKLPFLDSEIQKRQEIALEYSRSLKNCITPKIGEKRTSVFAQYSIRVKNRENIVKKLKEKGIPTAIHYPLPIHLQEAFAYLGYTKNTFPISELVAQEILSLPLSAFLNQEEQEYIIQCFNQINY